MPLNYTSQPKITGHIQPGRLFAAAEPPEAAGSPQPARHVNPAFVAGNCQFNHAVTIDSGATPPFKDDSVHSCRSERRSTNPTAERRNMQQSVVGGATSVVGAPAPGGNAINKVWQETQQSVVGAPAPGETGSATYY